MTCALHRMICAAAMAALPTAVFAAAAIPDLTGHWGRNAFNFEPIPGGPQPVMNLSRMPNGASNIGQLVGDYHNPILKPETSAIIRQKGEISLSGRAYPDPSNQCRPYNPPFTLAMQLGVEMLQGKNSITFIYDQDDQVRRVRLNSAHPKTLVPSPMGDSIGHYEGGALVVDTIGVKPGPYAMVDRYGSPVTDSLHVVETYRLIDGPAAKQAQQRYENLDGRLNAAPREIDPDTGKKGLQVFVTVEDPKVFTTPWSGYVTYRPMAQSMAWLEQVCAENPAEYYKDRWIGLPKAEKPDF
ncbi:MAG TPA: hypothetical protein VFW28_17425 [Micropepsaceae bacterium]|nr:hypothetical protein [Micropepsaceae bacterium]